MAYKTLLVEVAPSVATVTLNRPEVRNAFNEIVIAELTQAFRHLGQHPEVRVIVLAAEGPAFCAGADLNWMKKMAGFSHEENLADAKRLSEMLHQIYACPKPVIAKVQGDCYAGGMGLVAACDIAVATEQVQFCLSEVKLGLTPATISPYVIKAMGANPARRYFVTAERFSATEAHRIGFVHEVVMEEKLDETVALLVKAIVNNSPNAVQQTKSLVREVTYAPIDQQLLLATAERIATIRSSEEGREGVASFLEKRKPNWLL